MSRLTEKDVQNLPDRLGSYDSHLKAICGTGLIGIAQNASGKQASPSGIHVGVVPVTSGLGIIGGFCGAVAAISRYLGAVAAVTKATDVRGLGEAVLNKYDVIFTADDNTFVALNPVKRLASDNSEATGRGFAAALDLAAKGVAGKEALVLGAGPVGLAAAAVLDSRGAKVTVYDNDTTKASFIQKSLPCYNISRDLKKSLEKIPLVLDATPSPCFISRDMLRDDTIIAMPGVPSSLCIDAGEFIKERLIQDVLNIGVATMLLDVI